MVRPVEAPPRRSRRRSEAAVTKPAAPIVQSSPAVADPVKVPAAAPVKDSPAAPVKDSPAAPVAAPTAPVAVKERASITDWDATRTDSGCRACRLVEGATYLSATVPSGANGADSAYGVSDFGGSRGWSGRLFARSALGLAKGQRLSANLAVMQVRDARGALVYELYLEPNRHLSLWSPPGGLRAKAVNLSTGVVVPNDGRSMVRAEVSALRNASVILRVNGVDRMRLGRLAGAKTGNPRYIRVGIDHYDASAKAGAVAVFQGLTGVSTLGWLGIKKSPKTSLPERARAADDTPASKPASPVSPRLGWSSRLRSSSQMSSIGPDPLVDHDPLTEPPPWTVPGPLVVPDPRQPLRRLRSLFRVAVRIWFRILRWRRIRVWGITRMGRVAFRGRRMRVSRRVTR